MRGLSWGSMTLVGLTVLVGCQATPQPNIEATVQAAVAAARTKAVAIGTKMDIAVVDAGANLKAFVRMDGAWIGSIDIAIKKA